MLWTLSAELIALHVSASKWVCSFVEITEACSVFVSEAPNFHVPGSHVDYEQSQCMKHLVWAGEAAMHEDGRRCAGACWLASAESASCVRAKQVWAFGRPIVGSNRDSDTLSSVLACFVLNW